MFWFSNISATLTDSSTQSFRYNSFCQSVRKLHQIKNSGFRFLIRFYACTAESFWSANYSTVQLYSVVVCYSSDGSRSPPGRGAFIRYISPYISRAGVTTHKNRAGKWVMLSAFRTVYNDSAVSTTSFVLNVFEAVLNVFEAVIDLCPYESDVYLMWHFPNTILYSAGLSGSCGLNA